MSLSAALDALSQAHGPAALAAAFTRLTQTVRKARTAADKGLGTLAQVFVAAMTHWDAQKADGVPVAERQRGLEATLRVAWPQTRVWHYLCANCNDIGLVISACPGDATCGRPRAHLAHDVGTPCWCTLGAKFRAPEKPNPEDFTQAARAKPTRIGRRS